MFNKVHIFVVSLIWGLSIYSFQLFLESPESRIPILTTILLAFLIASANYFLVSEKIYRNKYLKFIVPLGIMNIILLLANVVRVGYDFLLNPRNYVPGLIFWNLIIFGVYSYQIYYNKRMYKTRLQEKIQSLENHTH